MNRLLTLTLIIVFSACGRQTERGESMNTNSVRQPTDSSTTENVKKQKEISESKDSKEQQAQITLQFSNGLSHEKLKLTEETVVVIQMDSLEIEQIKKIDGEDNFYTAADDLMWYNSMMLEKMDSLGISVKYTDKDTVDFYYHDNNWRIVKDSTFSLYTYFHFDGKEIKRTELFELIDE
tara:strand:- start:309 stop:845 length:537 start_codon:yes stop_codon:yes gene_type:complete